MAIRQIWKRNEKNKQILTFEDKLEFLISSRQVDFSESPLITIVARNTEDRIKIASSQGVHVEVFDVLSKHVIVESKVALAIFLGLDR